MAIHWWRKQPLLVAEKWKPRTWGLVDLLVCVLLLFAIQSFVYGAATRVLGIDLQEADPSQLRSLELSAMVSCGFIATALMTALWIVLRHRTTFAHVGLSTKRTGQFLFFGLIAGLCTLPVVYAISAAVTLGLDKKYEHPILDQMVADGSLNSYFYAAFAAVIAAPIAEELFFRVFVQGWMQSIPFSSIASIVIGASEQKRSNAQSEFYHPFSAAGGAFAGLPGSEQPPQKGLLADDGSDPEAGSHSAELAASEPKSNLAEQNTLPPIWPSVVTGVLFGLAHLDYGYSFVPLIVFGFVLGLIYRATQSVWPCILVHMMLNGTSIITLGVTVYAKQVIGQ